MYHYLRALKGTLALLGSPSPGRSNSLMLSCHLTSIGKSVFSHSHKRRQKRNPGHSQEEIVKAVPIGVISL